MFNILFSIEITFCIFFSMESRGLFLTISAGIPLSAPFAMTRTKVFMDLLA